MFISIRRFTMLCLLVLPCMASAAEEITFRNQTLPIMPGENASAFFTVTSRTDDVMVSAESPCCQAVELHTHTVENDIIRMRKVEEVPLKARVPTVFKSGGLHVMLIGLKTPLKKGSNVPVTFHFEKGADQDVLFTAQPPHLHGSTDSPKHH